MLESLNAFKVILVALNLIILYTVLRKLLFKPVTQFMENRTNAIRDSIENAEKTKSEAEELKRRYEEQLRSARAEGARLIDEARARADREHDRLVAEARAEAEGILDSAREEIERERMQMLKEIRGQVAGLALAAASKIVEANMDTESNRTLVDRFIDEAGAA
jgi:F-type H+-transporting ATPase subunit b